MNKTTYSDSVQVWVGAGTYTDYKGFVMRDSVTVLGGFPAGKFAAPAMSERQALMTNVINIPKSKPAANFNAEDYETILQISDVNPKTDIEHFNTGAAKYWDDDYSYSEFTETTQYEYKNRTIVHHYSNTDIVEIGDDVQDTYMQYANMANGSEMVVNTTTTTYSGDNDTVYRTLWY